MSQNGYRKRGGESLFVRHFLTRTHFGPQGLPMEFLGDSQGQVLRMLARFRHRFCRFSVTLIRCVCNKCNRQYLFSWFWVRFSEDGAKRGGGVGRSPLNIYCTYCMYCMNHTFRVHTYRIWNRTYCTYHTYRSHRTSTYSTFRTYHTHSTYNTYSTSPKGEGVYLLEFVIVWKMPLPLRSWYWI